MSDKPMELDPTRIQGICFDVDGTLRDTDDAMVLDLSGWLRPFGYINRSFKPDRFARRVIMAIENPGNFLYTLTDRMGLDDWLAVLNRRAIQRGVARHGRHAIIPGIYEMLARLYPHYPLAIVSSRGELKTIDFLERFNLATFFKAIATGQTTRHTKPYPDPILWAAEKMGIDPRTCIMVGDTTVDIRAGLAAGAQTVGVLCGFGEEEELRRAGAHLILPDPTGLVPLLLAES